jgi:hypothetical protein
MLLVLNRSTKFDYLQNFLKWLQTVGEKLSPAETEYVAFVLKRLRFQLIEEQSNGKVTSNHF